MIVAHYLNGAYYPEGGAERIARAAERVIEHTGGAVLINSEMRSMLLDGNRAVGVRIRHLPSGEQVDYRADILLSNVGARQTYDGLLPAGEVLAVDAIAGRLRKPDCGYSAVVLYLGLNREPGELGISGENYWIITDTNPNDLAGATDDLLARRPRTIYMSFPSASGACTTTDHVHTRTPSGRKRCGHTGHRESHDGRRCCCLS